MGKLWVSHVPPPPRVAPGAMPACTQLTWSAHPRVPCCTHCAAGCSQENRWIPGPSVRQSYLGPGPVGMALGFPRFMQIPGVMGPSPPDCCAFLALGFLWGCWW